MPRWFPQHGRDLVFIAIGGLFAATVSRGSEWLLLALLGLAGVGFIVSALTRAAPERDERSEIYRLADSLLLETGASAPTAEQVGTPREAIARAIDRMKVGRAEDRTRVASLESLINSIDEAVVATGADGRIVLCNAAASSLIGVPSERLIGRPIDEAFTQPDFARMHADALRGERVHAEIRVQAPDGPRIWETSAISYIAGPGNGVAFTMRDATERALAFQVKTDFVANASHELRTPIAAIRVAVDTLESLGDEDTPMRGRTIAMIASHTNRLEEMVRDLLDLSKLETPESTIEAAPLPGSALREELRGMFERAASDKNLTLRFELTPELERFQTDRNLVLLILGNLIDNACKFAFEGTEVVISGRAEGDGVRFEVSDKGVGIPLAQQQRIFERFFQVDPARSGGMKRGTGLGLSIVKHAVRRLGGTIRVNSVWHQGTTMIVDLPNSLTS